MSKIEEIFEQVQDLPTLPTVYTSLLKVMGDTRSSVNDVADIIAQDLAASTKILKTVNSSLYSIKSKVDTITQAIFHLGFNEVKNLVAALSVMDMFDKSISLPSFSILDLWKHSIAVAVTTRNIGKEIGIKNIENYFLAGLIHDIGQFFFIKNVVDDYAMVMSFVTDYDMNLIEAEDETLETNHLKVGEQIAKKWDLPTSITNSIRHHDTGFINEEANLQVACVHLSDILVRILNLGFAGDNDIPKPNVKIWDVLKLEEKSIIKIVEKVKIDYEQSVSIMLST